MSEGAPVDRPSVRIPLVVDATACGDEVVAWADGALQINVVASGRGGGADDAVETLLAEVLGVERDGVRVIAGRGARHKWIEIDDCDDDDLEGRLPGRRARERGGG